MTTQEQAERRAAYYADLRSGERKRTEGTMRSTVDGKLYRYCCLGVAQQRYQDDQGDEADTQDGESAVFNIKSRTILHGILHLGVLSEGARLFYGFDSRDPEIHTFHGDVWTAAECNDNLHVEFPEIADLFEARFPAVADEEVTQTP